jgi:hypothetical protein
MNGGANSDKKIAIVAPARCANVFAKSACRAKLAALTSQCSVFAKEPRSLALAYPVLAI